MYLATETFPDYLKITWVIPILKLVMTKNYEIKGQSQLNHVFRNTRKNHVR